MRLEREAQTYPASIRSRVAERFSFIRTIGEGATGRVFEVEDVVLGGRLALKQLRRDHFASPDHVARFKDEFRGFQRITHPNLVKVYELISEAEDTFVLMELVLGQSFIEYAGLHPENSADETGDTTRPIALPRRRSKRAPETVRLRSPPSVDRLRAALRQLVSGVSALHAEGKVHCDIKPSNVLVTPDGRVVILDFGCATETKHEDGWLRGTFLHMAPEQYEGVYTEAVDWYAVGTLLYEALTGRHAFPGRSSGHAYSKGPVRLVDPRSIDPHLPDDLSALALGLLVEQPDKRPSPEEIARVVGLQPPSRPKSPRLLGREAELRQLQTALEETRGGTSRVVHIQGESGIGKTALLNHFTRPLLDEGIAVLRGNCYVDASVPYKGLDSLVDSLATLLDRLDIPLDDDARESIALMFPVFSRNVMPPESLQDPALLRQHAVDAFRLILERLTECGPVVACIDDFQWSDVESINLLAEVLRAPLPPGILFILSYRAGPTSGDNRAQLIRERLPCHDSVALGPLGRDVIHAMASDADETVLNSIVKESQGNPLFAGELLRAHAEGEIRAPLTFAGLLASRLGRLGASERAYLELVALAGQPIDDEVVARAVNTSRARSLEVRRNLIAASLLRDSQSADCAVEAYHDRIREYVLGEITPEAARRRHAALAEAYEHNGTADPETLLIHHRGAGNISAACTFAERAGDVGSTVLAFDHAADLYNVALQMAASAGGHELRIKYARALSNAGRPLEAADAFLAALKHQPESVDLRLAAGDEFLRAGDAQRGVELLRHVARTLGEPIPRSRLVLRLRLLWNALKLRWARIPPVEELTSAENPRLALCNSIGFRLVLANFELGTLFRLRYFYLALKAKARVHVINGLSHVAGVAGLAPRWVAGGIARTEQLVTACQALLHQEDPLETQGIVGYGTSMAAFIRGRWRAHRETLEPVAALGRDRRAVGLRWSTAFVESDISSMLQMEGNIAEMRRRLPDYLAMAKGYQPFEAVQRLVCGTTLALCDDQPDDAHHSLDETVKAWPARSWGLQHHLAVVARAEVDLYAGKHASAHETLTSAWPRTSAVGLFTIAFYRFGALALRARIALAAGRGHDAARDIRHLETRRDGWAAATGRALRASLLVQMRRHDAAVSLLERCVPELDGWDLALYAGAARYRLAELTQDREGKARAHELFSSRGVRNPARLVRFLLPFGPAERDEGGQAP